MAKPKNSGISPYDSYINQVYRIVLLATPLVVLTTGVTYTIQKLLGYVDYVNTQMIVIYDLFCIISFLIGQVLSKCGIDEKGVVIPKMLLRSKIYLTLLALIQWQYVSYLNITKEMWGISFFFVICVSFFFDYVIVGITMAGITGSILVKWLIYRDVDNITMAYRMVIILFTMAGFLFLMYLVDSFLVRELEKNANYDTLTRLLNRRSLDGYLQRAYQDAKSGKEDFALVMIDIDNFKKVNDTYGHEFGDEVLKAVGNVLTRGTHKNDMIFRWGGEEFLLILYTNSINSINVADRIRKDIQADPIVGDKNSLYVTVTMGVSNYRDGITIKEMLEEADANLYKGKKSGKNKVVA